MKKFLLLRGKVPTDRPKQQIMFDNIYDCDDMWSLLFRELSKDGYGEIWYWGDKRIVEYSSNLKERWINNFRDTKYDFKPDVIFTRGGFKEYDHVLRRNPQAYKIYYGAGYRGTPVNDFKEYNLILSDTPKQLKNANQQFPKIKSALFIKPSADNIFKPYPSEGKKYDVILVGNYYKKLNKGHDFAFSRIPRHYEILSVGLVPKDIQKKYSRVTYLGWLPRKELPKYYASSKLAVVCCGKEDSSPRVIPEALSCNCPILVLERVNFWKKRYINKQTGETCLREDFAHKLNHMITKYKEFSPYEYYKNNLSIEKSVELLNRCIYGED